MSDLWQLVRDDLYRLAADAARALVPRLPPPAADPAAAGTVLAERLQTPVDTLPPGNALVELARGVLGDLPTGSAVRLHGWQRAQGAPRGVALVLTDGAGRAVLAITPTDPPVIDVAVVPATALTVPLGRAPWRATVTVAAPEGWDVAYGPGLAPGPPRGTARVELHHDTPLRSGFGGGPGIGVDAVAATLDASPAGATTRVSLVNLAVAVLPTELAVLLGAAPDSPLRGAHSDVTVLVGGGGGLRFDTGGVRLDLPLRIDAPGIRTRGVALELTDAGGRLGLAVTASVQATLPGLPLRAELAGAGFTLPLALQPQGLVDAVADRLPDGIDVDLALPPVSGGGLVRRTPDGGWGGLIAIDLGFVALQAVALLRPPAGSTPTTFLVLLAARFPPPGIQLGFGFALSGVGGLVGVNRRVDADVLRRLVCEGHADTVLFPDHAAERADEIVTALATAFPSANRRFLVGPMLQLTWLAERVSLSAALVLELPAPVRATLIGRLLVALPDPVVPLVRLQASVLGRIDPGVPVVELLASLAGSWIVGLTVSGEIYLLVRGGDQPVFVLSAGGFHPRYTRPPGVPALGRLALDLAPGGSWGLRVEAYLAVTSNAVMFGGRVQLEAMIAGCGVEGWLGLDALFVMEPTFGFSVHVYAGVAVRAFGHRLAGIGLDFTLEGPGPWHAFGTGSVSVLFWDASLDFDIRWGSGRAAVARAGDDPTSYVRTAVAATSAWAVEQPAADRTALAFTADARRALADGTLVHPDAHLRMSQAVVPLGVPITRFGGRRIPAQTWTVASVRIGDHAQDAPPPTLPERFLPGEYFDLTEDEKLTARATQVLPGGVALAIDGSNVGAGVSVEDRYETGYQPRRDGQARQFRSWAGRLAAEAVRPASAAERAQRWRTAQVQVVVRP